MELHATNRETVLFFLFCFNFLIKISHKTYRRVPSINHFYALNLNYIVQYFRELLEKQKFPIFIKILEL